MRAVRNWLKKLNAFEGLRRNTADSVGEQRRATYVYYLLLLTAVFSFGIYDSLSYSTVNIVVTHPSLKQYQQLQLQYGVDKINCPCSQLSITYTSLIDLNCDFHPVCRSPFISHKYLQELFEVYNTFGSLYPKEDAFTLQGTIFSHFQALLSLCNLAEDNVKDARQQYLNSSFISTSMIDYNLFDLQLNASLEQFKSTLPDEFLNNLQLLRGMTQSNAFVSLYSTNWYPIIYNLQDGSKVYMHPQSYGQCNCLTSSTCTQPSTPFIPGYLVGCTPLEALLRSSIQCLYERTCVDFLTNYLNLTLPGPTPLNTSDTHFPPNVTVDSIVQEMFIETCSSNVSYDQFFEQCHPLSCSVTLIKPNNLVIVITKILGIYGGLTTFLKLVIPILVIPIDRLFRTYKRRLTNQVRPFHSWSYLFQHVTTQQMWFS